MLRKFFHFVSISAIFAFLVFSAQAADNSDTLLEAKVMTIIKHDFHDKGIAKIDRLNQDSVQAMCTKFLDNPPIDNMEHLQAEQEKAIRWPADGKYMGNWKAGEELAQSGSGMTWSDKPDAIPGGNCYNCHQLSAIEPGRPEKHDCASPFKVLDRGDYEISH